MDVKLIGVFLSILRKERGLTQEQLAEKLGTTNKTVSRWETGTYLPPVEMLQQLSSLYGITINEILAAERLDGSKYQEKAEENIKAVLRFSAFSLEEKVEFYKKKWIKDHLFSTVLGYAVILAVMIWGVVCNNGLQLLALVGGVGFAVVRNNQMMTYVEKRAFDGSGRQ